MMLSIALLALVRLIPYGLIAFNAWTKGYKWLTLAGIWYMGVAVLNYAVATNADVRAVLASVGAVLMMMHALDLKQKNRG